MSAQHNIPGSRLLGLLAAAAVAAVALGAGAAPATAADPTPCGKEVTFPETGLTMQSCPLTSPLAAGVPVYTTPVPNPAGATPPAPAGWMKNIVNRYFECDQRFPNAVYYHPTGGWRNVWWAKTIGDGGVTGWVPEVFFDGGANDEPDAGLRACPPPPAEPPPPSACAPPGPDTGVELRAHLKGGRRSLTTSYNGRPVVHGKLVTDAGIPVAGASVCVAQVVSRADSGREEITSVLTDTAGRFTHRLGKGPSRRVSFVYRGGGTAGAAAVQVRVRAPVTLSASARRVKTGETVKFHGKFGRSEGRAGAIAAVQVRRKGDWESLLGTVRTREEGRFTDAYEFTFTEGVHTYAFRGHVPGQRGVPFATGSSKIVRVTVKG